MSEHRLTIAEQKTLTRALRRSVRFVGDGHPSTGATPKIRSDDYLTHSGQTQ